MSVSLSPLFNGYQSFLTTGLPNNGGFIYTYAAGSTTPQATYTTNTGGIANANPIPLGADGRPPQEIWLTDGLSYKFVLTDALLTTLPSSTFDNITGVVSPTTLATLASPSGASTVGFQQAFAGSISRTVQDELRDSISLFDALTPAQIADVQANTYTVDITVAVNIAISAAAVLGKWLRIPAGGYKVIPATAKTDEAGSNLCAFPMTNNMYIWAEPGATFKIANGVSSDAAPIRMSMFFSNSVLNSIKILGLTMDMNGANNTISPARPTTYNNYTNAHLIFSGTPAGIAANGTDVTIENCKFLNGAGASCIVAGQSNTIGGALGTRWNIRNNYFYNNGLDCNDHSSVYAWATVVDVSGNTFENPLPLNNTTGTGGYAALEIHGSNTSFNRNRIKNYYRGLYIAQNLTEVAVRNTEVYGNRATVSGFFFDFYSANQSFSFSPSESPHEQVVVYGNTIEITSDAVPDTVKAFFKFASGKMPKLVRVEGNVCRSYETTKNCVMALLIVSPNQLVKGDQIVIKDNTAAGIVAGMVAFFSGNGATAATQNIGSVEFSNNRLGALQASPGSVYPNQDVYLYGSAAGRIEALRLYGLETPLAQVGTDVAAAGRATVYGKALLTLPIVWNGLTLGNATQTKRVGLDTDAGHATVSLYLAAGTTTTALGPIYPTITGLVADSNGVTSALVKYATTITTMSGEIDSTSSYIQPFSNAGFMTDAIPSPFTTSTKIFVGGNFPCSSANI